MSTPARRRREARHRRRQRSKTNGLTNVAVCHLAKNALFRSLSVLSVRLIIISAARQPAFSRFTADARKSASKTPEKCNFSKTHLGIAPMTAYSGAPSTPWSASTCERGGAWASKRSRAAPNRRCVRTPHRLCAYGTRRRFPACAYGTFSGRFRSKSARSTDAVLRTRTLGGRPKRAAVPFATAERSC